MMNLKQNGEIHVLNGFLLCNDFNLVFSILNRLNLPHFSKTKNEANILLLFCF